MDGGLATRPSGRRGGRRSGGTDGRRRGAAPARAKETLRHVDAVIRALDILGAVGAAPSLSLAEIARATGLARSRIMRLAGTLESRGYLDFDGERGRYRLGSRLLTLGRAFEQHNDLIALARPVLRRLVEETGESATLYGIDGVERVALAREHGRHQVHFSVIEGGRSELFAGAAGKVLLAFGAPGLLQRVLAKGIIRPLTAHTITDPDRLRRELDRVRQRGIAFSRGERVADAWALAVPVLDHAGRVCAALAVAGPVNRLTPALRTTAEDALCRAGRELSGRLGWLAANPPSAARNSTSSRGRKGE